MSRPNSRLNCEAVVIRVEQKIEVLSAEPFPCPNCDAANPNQASVYCSELCVSEAQFVRLFRARRAEGRDQDPDVKNGLEIQFAMIVSGGYSKKARHVPPAVRRAVFARDQDKCRHCGEPGTTLDHIAGDSSDLENLQCLCVKCHDEKTRSRFRKLSPETNPEGWAKSKVLWERVLAPQPLRLCDGIDWEKYWRVIQRVKKDGPQQSLGF